jgi:hypothetical protein
MKGQTLLYILSSVDKLYCLWTNFIVYGQTLLSANNSYFGCVPTLNTNNP